MAYKKGNIYLRLSILFLCLTFIGCSACKQKLSPQAETSIFAKEKNLSRVALLFTADVLGHVEPCGCTSAPLGGIDKLTTLVKEAQDAFFQQVVFIDAGNLLFEQKEARLAADLCQDNARVDLLLSTYSKLGLLGTIVGPYDEARGKEFWQKKYQQFHIQQLTSKGHLVKRGNRTLAIVGLTDVDIGKEEEWKKLLEEQKAQSDAIVLVSTWPKEKLHNLLADIEGVQVVISSFNPAEIPLEPERIGKESWLISAGKDGQYLGVVEFYFVPGQKLKLDDTKLKREQNIRLLEKRIQAWEKQLKEELNPEKKEFLFGRLQKTLAELQVILKDVQPLTDARFSVQAIPLSRRLASDQAVKIALQEYNDKIPKMVAQCEVGVVCQAVKANQAVFVGAETCRQCHQEAYNIWQKAIVDVPGQDEQGKSIVRRSGHAKAWETLEKIHKEKNRSCIGCHSIGFELPGGYCKVNEVDFRKNVQCESCHGAGSLHASTADKRLIQREVPESTCRSCHHVPHIPTTDSFIYNEKLKLILGPGHGHALLEKLNHGK